MMADHPHLGVIDLIRAIKNKDVTTLECLPIGYDKTRIISHIKNDLDLLEFFLAWADGSISNGKFDIWSNIKDKKTIDLYKKYGIEPERVNRHDMSIFLWDYMISIRFTPDTYCAGCYICAQRECNDNVKCVKCSCR